MGGPNRTIQLFNSIQSCSRTTLPVRRPILVCLRAGDQSSLLSPISRPERLSLATNFVLHRPIRPGLRARHSVPAELCSAPFVV